MILRNIRGLQLQTFETEGPYFIYTGPERGVMIAVPLPYGVAVAKGMNVVTRPSGRVVADDQVTATELSNIPRLKGVIE